MKKQPIKKTKKIKKSSEEVEKTPGEKVMEKSGKLLLTEAEYRSIQKGVVPDRIKETWGVTLAEARDMLMCGYYEVIKST